MKAPKIFRSSSPQAQIKRPRPRKRPRIPVASPGLLHYPNGLSGPDRKGGLPAGLRGSMENYFQRDLSGVNLHTGPQARLQADGIQAKAYTHGQNIYLGSEGERTSGDERTRLVAHEVVHTIQQSNTGPAMQAKPKIGKPGDQLERQADRHAANFVRQQNGSDQPIALEKTSVPIGQVSTGVPMIQRDPVDTYYGTFEDYNYHDLTMGKDQVGVSMHLKFHPNENTIAENIALTQTVKQVTEGKLDFEEPIFGLRSAKEGAGVGFFVDVLKEHPNPLYATEMEPLTSEGSEELGGYGFKEFKAAEGKDRFREDPYSARPPVGELEFRGGAQKTGYRREKNGGFESVPAEIYDAPHLKEVKKNSSQVFETAAISYDKSDNQTYLGSVSWGWERDGSGKFNRLPLSLKSKSVPTTEFLTAAHLWNVSKVSLGFEVLEATEVIVLEIVEESEGSLLFQSEQKAKETKQTINAGTILEPYLGSSFPVVMEGKTYFEVGIDGNKAYVRTNAVGFTTIGKETVDLPIPETGLVSEQSGATLTLKDGSKTILIEEGERLKIRKILENGTYEVTVIGGEYAGSIGTISKDSVEIEPLGTR